VILATMKASAHRSAQMVQQVLSFARGVSGNSAVLAVKPLIAEVAKLAKETFPRSLQIEIKLAEQLYSIQGNATQLHQVLLNLCINARDAMPEGGALRIEADVITLKNRVTDWQPEPATGPYVVLSVCDTGHGIPPEILPRIFEPFFTTKDSDKGTGLGLSTVCGIVKSHGGFIEVSSEPGAGAVFKVYLPALPMAKPATTLTASPALPAGQGEQILVVDDDLAVLEMTRGTLEAFNYRVVTAPNGAEAISVYQRHKREIQAVISDLMMPVMDGAAAIRVLQKIDPFIKVIGVSGLGSDAGLLRAGALDVQGFLKKPFTTEALLTTLHHVLQNSGESESQSLDVRLAIASAATE
jgi:CheY-like chemotaxis protein